MGGRSQEALYSEIDLELSWSEAELPQAERTKHVHGLHPYLGKFIPQLVERLLERFVRPGGRVLDPFAGLRHDARPGARVRYDAVGVDIAAFNCLLMRVKTARYDLFRLEKELRDVLDRRGSSSSRRDGFVADWYAPRAAAELLHLRDLVGEYEHADVLRVVLARAARSARLTRHFDLDFPRAPQREAYWCHKHRRECRPVEEADKFIARYLLDTLERLKGFQRVRRRGHAAEILHADAREARLGGPYDAVLTSPPYPGLIDYHEQHRYAYELLELDDRRDRELGAAARGTSRAAVVEYVAGISGVLDRCVASLAPRAPVIVVVNDRRDLYPEIFERAGLDVVERLERHVNRRTGRRAGEYFESVFVAVRVSLISRS